MRPASDFEAADRKQVIDAISASIRMRAGAGALCLFAVGAAVVAGRAGARLVGDVSARRSSHRQRFQAYLFGRGRPGRGRQSIRPVRAADELGAALCLFAVHRAGLAAAGLVRRGAGLSALVFGQPRDDRSGRRRRVRGAAHALGLGEHGLCGGAAGGKPSLVEEFERGAAQRAAGVGLSAVLVGADAAQILAGRIRRRLRGAVQTLPRHPGAVSSLDPALARAGLDGALGSAAAWRKHGGGGAEIAMGVPAGVARNGLRALDGRRTGVLSRAREPILQLAVPSLVRAVGRIRAALGAGAWSRRRGHQGGVVCAAGAGFVDFAAAPGGAE
ncbi:MAG: hypothetical protein BWZ10_02048 [candidate division BRC1 bacterium ADurb.BinA364]|nr:MAG: hypothetical protein BWZ10_02048 [candidate division BRC1 bacterium ADurb.BinA364]